MRNTISTYGAEVEKPVANLKTGISHKTSQAFFHRLQKEAEKRGTFNHLHQSDLKSDITLGVVSNDIGEQGLDNGFNLLETSTAVMPSLNDLANLLKKDLITIQQSLENEGATVINMSNHPLGETSFRAYQEFVAPKGVYQYLWHGGWDHTSGINAKAQNSPSTGVAIEDAADALSVIIGVGAALVGIFANSPYEEGTRSLYKESRLTMWERMMKYSKNGGDLTTSQFPPKRFETLAEYFEWMFGEKTTMHFILSRSAGSESKDYKSIGDRILLVHGNPSVLSFLSQPDWEAISFKELITNFPPAPIKIKPSIDDMSILQFTNFSGGRIRYSLKNNNFPLQKFVEACRNRNKREVESIFETYAEYIYIEGRDPGANFPDQELWEAGEEIARSAIIAPSVIQAGLIRNLPESRRLIAKNSWKKLGELRLEAIKNGLQGVVEDLTVEKFAREVVEIAARGLRSDEQWMLDYPLWVLKTGKNGADRAIEFVENHKEGGVEAIKDLIQSRKVVVENL